MILNVDLASELLIYQQLRDQIVEAIADGALTEGSPLPATRALAADFGINFHTVNKAWLWLRRRWQRPLPLTDLTATGRGGHLEPVRQS